MLRKMSLLLDPADSIFLIFVCVRIAYQKSGTNIGKTIDPPEFTDEPLVKEYDQKIPAHSIVLALPNSVSEMDPKYHHLGGKYSQIPIRTKWFMSKHI